MILGIYGAGGLGREVYDLAIRINTISRRWEKIIFIDDFSDEREHEGVKKVKFSAVLDYKNEFECIIAIGEPSLREFLCKKVLAENINLTTLIDPTAIISPLAKIQEGAIVCEYSTIHAGAKIGCNALIQPFCCIGHDIIVGDHTVLSSYCAPGGGTVFGSRVFVGLHAALKESLNIGNDVIIGMGSIVYRDIPDGATVVGNPARITKGNDEQKVFGSIGKLSSSGNAS